jgi:polar amino acid transport system substrate-binding protein
MDFLKRRQKMQRAGSECQQAHRARIAAFAAAFLAAVLPLAAAGSAGAATLDRVKGAGKLVLGYRTDARPFSYRDEANAAAGYSVELCQKIAEQMKTELALPSLGVEWAPVTLADRFTAVQQSKVDLLCGADTETLTRRRDVSFSIPTFPSGIGALLRADAAASLRLVLAQGQPPSNPLWRGSPARTVLEKKTFSIVTGTTSEAWLAGRLDAFDLDANVAPVASYAAGLQRVLDRNSDVLFGDRPILLDAARHNAATGDLIVLDRLFTSEPVALALARNDDDFRLLVDRTLSRLFRSRELLDLYLKWFGNPDQSTLTFFRQTVLPE